MKKLTLLLAALCCTFASFAQTDAKATHIRELLEVTGSAKMGIQMMHAMIESYKNSYPKTGDAFWDSFMAEVKADDLVNLIIPIYAKYYTDEDIIQLTAFYKTPIGQKTIQIMPGLMKESLGVGQAWGKELGEKALKKMKDAGLMESN